MGNMTNSLPTIVDPTQHSEQTKNNNGQAERLFKEFFPNFPDFATPFDDVFLILSHLEKTGVNPQILPRVIRGIHNITNGTGKGQVIVNILGPVTNVSVREQDEELNTIK